MVTETADTTRPEAAPGALNGETYMTNHPSYNPHTGALAEVVARAIRDSIEEGRSVRLEHSDALAEALALECEVDHEGEDAHEFWGITSDGETWRIHLDR